MGGFVHDVSLFSWLRSARMRLVGRKKMGLRSGLAVVFSLVGPASVLTSITVLFNFSNPGNTSQDFNLHVTTIKLGSIR